MTSSGLPSGTVTFLFTDIVASTQSWAADADAMSSSLRVHDAVLREAIESHGGFVFTTAGDAFCAAFGRAADGVAAGVAAQDRLGDAAWPGPALSVRIGLHVGDAELRDGDYFGPTVNVAARVAALANGGQVLLTAAAATAANSADVTDLGSHPLRGVDVPMQLFQIGGENFQPLSSAEPADIRYRFDEFEIDGPAQELLRDGEPIHLEPQVFDVLTHLAANSDRLVSREELLDEVWGDQFVSLSALTSRIKTARQALGDDGKTQRYIRTVHGRGYQFVPTPTLAHDRPTTSSLDVLGTTGTPGTVRAPGPVVGGSMGLPHTAESLIGRQYDLDTALAALQPGSVVTLVGPGGVGKTRLSIEVARRWSDERKVSDLSVDRTVVFIALDGVREPGDVRSALATMLGVDVVAGSDVVRACAEWLATGARLLIVDNCEHVLEAIAEVLMELLSHAPNLSVLATSREPLHIPPERVRRLGTLAVSGSEELSGRVAGGVIDELGPAVELFVARAQRSDATFELDERNVDDVVRLCTALDGLPLAVELAASRIGPLGLPELVASLESKLDVVHALRGDADDRHHSLRSTIEWSFERLSVDAQRMLSCLARFPAGLTFVDLEPLCRLVDHEGQPADIVSQLVDTSMLFPRDSVGGTRYNMLETVRDYATERSGTLELNVDPETMLIEHAVRIAADERAVWEPGDSSRAYGRLREEIPNIRAAREALSESGDNGRLISLSAGLLSFTEEACLAEVWGWIDELADVPAPDDPVRRSEAGAIAAAAARNRGDLEEASRLARDVIELDADDWAVGRSLHALAMASLFGGELDAAATHWLEMDERIHTLRGRSYAALAVAYQGRIDRAWELLDEVGATLGDRTPVQVEIAYYFISGEVARIASDPAARELLERAIALGTEHECWFTVGVCSVTLVSLLVEDGDIVAAAESYIELIDRWLRAGTWPQLWTTLRNVADIPGELDDETRLVILAAADRDAQAPVLDADATALQVELIEECRDRLGGERADAVFSSARRLLRGEIAQRAVLSLRALIETPPGGDADGP